MGLSPSRKPLPAPRPRPRPAALSVWRWIGRLTLTAAFAGGLYALVYGGWRFVTSSPRFNVDDVALEGVGKLRHVVHEALVRRMNVLGHNVFTLDTDALARDLEADPWIRHAEVSRELPARLIVRVREERVVALVAMDGLYLADEEGRLFKRLGVGDGVDLPVINGVPRALYEEKAVEAVARIREGIAVTRAFSASPAARRARLEEVTMDAARGPTLELTLGDAACVATVRLGRDAHAAKLARLVRVLDALAARGVQPELIVLDDVLQPDRVTVRMRARRDAPVILEES